LVRGKTRDRRSFVLGREREEKLNSYQSDESTTAAEENQTARCGSEDIFFRNQAHVTLSERKL
jgi:hypothetical protein